MASPIVNTLKINTPGDAIYPGLDENGEIIFTPEDGEVREVDIDSVEARTYMTKALSVTFKLKGADYDCWKVYITDQRVIAWSKMAKPSIMGLSGKGKPRKGYASVGQIYYSTLWKVGAYNDKEGFGVLVLMAQRYDASKSMMLLKCMDEDKLRLILTDVHRRANKWMEDNNVTVEPKSVYPKVYQTTMARWQTIAAKAWTASQPQEGLYVNVPRKSVEKVPNSRLGMKKEKDEE